MAQATATIYINGKEVENTLKGLTAEAARLNAELKRATLGEEDFANKAEQLRKVTAILDDQKKALKDYADLYKTTTPVVAGSINALKTKHTELLKELDNLKRGTTEYNAKLKQVGESSQEIKKVNDELAKASKTTVETSSNVKKMTGVLAAAFVADQVVSWGTALGGAVVKYQNAASNLSAITGVTGEALEELKGYANDLTEIFLDNGKKITNSQTEILEAMKLVGSAKPELLKSAEGLSEVTKQAIILAKAAGQTVPEAVKDLTTVMNQFELPAKEAARIINTLAAGAKEGAAEIPDISAAIAEFGAGAKSANVSVEESVALVETLGDKMIKGSEAGTKLRNILIAIKAPEGLDKEARRQLTEHGVSFDILRDKSKSMGERLTELAKIQGDANALVQVFGKENVTAAEILLTNVTRFKQLTGAVTDTNEAQKQAAIMADNLGNDMKVLRDEAENAALNLGKKLAPAARSVVQGFTELLRWVKENWETLVLFGKAIVLVGGMMLSYIATIKAVAVAKRMAAVATAAYEAVVLFLTNGLYAAAVAQRALTFAMNINLLGAAIALVTALAAAYSLFSTTVTDTMRAQKMVNEVNNQAAKSIVDEKMQLEQLLKVARDDKRSKDERAAAIKKLNELSPIYLGNLTLEKINTEEATSAVDMYIKSLERKAKAEAANQKMRELQYKLMDLNDGATDTKASTLQSVGNSVLSFGNASAFSVLQAKSSVENFKEAKTGIQSQIDVLNKYIEKNAIDFVTPSTGPGKLDNATSAPKTKDAEKADKEAQRELNREEQKLQKLKDITQQYQNDVNQLNANHDASEEIRIREKYDKQIALAEELLKSRDPKIRKEAAETVAALQQLTEAEILATQEKHLRDLEINLKKHQEDANASEKADNEVRLTNIRQKYAKELAELELLEGSKKPEVAKKATEMRVALEAAMNAELEAETTRFNDAQEAKEIARLDKERQERIRNQADYLTFTDQTKVLELLNLEAHYQRLITASGLGEDQLTALKAANEKKRAEIIGKHAKERIDKEKEITNKIKGAENDLLNARYKAMETGIGLVRQFVGENTALGKALFAFEKAVAIAQILIDLAKQKSAIALTATDLARKAASLIPEPISAAAAAASAYAAYFGPATAAASVNAGMNIALVGATAIQGIVQKKDGGYSVRGADDGQIYDAQYIGAPQTGMLPPTPSLVLASEAGPEYFVSNAALTRPDVAWHVRMIDNIANGTVTQRKEGGYVGNEPLTSSPFEPLTATPFEPSTATPLGTDPILLSVLTELTQILREGIEATAVIGYSQVKDITTAQSRLASNKG